MAVRLRWGAGRMLHPPGRLLCIEQLHFLCLGASRATDTVLHHRLGTTSRKAIWRGHSHLDVGDCGHVASQPVCPRHRATGGGGVG
eukprot:5487993-Prymnesium_polylepis.1